MPTGQANWIEQISVVRSNREAPVGAGEAISEGYLLLTGQAQDESLFWLLMNWTCDRRSLPALKQEVLDTAGIVREA